MEENQKNDEKLFMYLINTFQSSAQIALGEMENPMTRKVETNLDQAGYYIDLLEMVKKKTKNNLTEYEEQMLINIISKLKMSLLSESKK